MTLRHVTVSGDPFAVGVALGREGGAAFRDVVRALPRFQALRRWLGSDRLKEIEAISRRAFPQLMREIDGIAAGAAVAFEEVFLWNCRGDLPGGAGFAGAQGCTDIMLPGDSASGQPAVIGHNEDDAPGLAGHCFVATVKPAAGPGFTSFCSPGQLLGHTFAVNSAGLVQTIDNVRPHDLRPGIGRHIIARAALDCRDLAAVRALLERTDRAAGFHHNLGQSGDMALWSVEAPASGCEIVAVDAPRAHTNHLISNRFSTLDQTITESSRDRQRRAESLIATDAVGRDPLTLLGDKEGPGLPICRKTRGGPDTGYTLATAVFEIDTTGVTWRVYDDPGAAPVLEGRVETRCRDHAEKGQAGARAQAG